MLFFFLRVYEHLPFRQCGRPFLFGRSQLGAVYATHTVNWNIFCYSLAEREPFYRKLANFLCDLLSMFA